MITGSHPSQCFDFTINAVPGNRAVMYGWITFDETDVHCLDDLFLLTYSQGAIVSCTVLLFMCIIMKFMM